MSHPETIGAYRVLGVIGEGGMGVVYRGCHRIQAKAARQGEVALKVQHAQLARIPELRQRFEREAELGMALDHPGVVKVFDLIDTTELVALVLECVEGSELEDLEPDRPEALRILEQLAETLDYLHDQGVVHRDLKPGNIRVRPGGQPVLLDFGIARTPESSHTRTGLGMGTPAYMAPEQFLDAKSVDARADVYALGMIAFRLLYRQFPWPEDLSEHRVLVLKDDGTLDLKAAGSASEVFRQALSQRPQERFARASAFVSALTSALSGEEKPESEESLDLGSFLEESEATDPGRAISSPPPARRPRSRGRRLVLLGAPLVLASGLGLVCCVGLGGLAVFVLHGEEADPVAHAPVGWDEVMDASPDPVAASSEPSLNPDAGEGAKAKREEGKVGKPDAKMEKAKGNKVEMDRTEIDRELAENAGVLGSLDGELGTFGDSGLNEDFFDDFDEVNGDLDHDIADDLAGGIGGDGTQMGSAGLGSRGSGLGGGGTSDGLGGLGTKGTGSGTSGYGSGGGGFGAKGEGGIGRIGGDPIILGALDKSLIDAVIKRNMNQIRYCYQRELTNNPNLSGKITVKFVIAKDGTVSSASTKASTMGSPAVENCINGRFLDFQFPEPKGGGIVIVSYPFIFSPG